MRRALILTALAAVLIPAYADRADARWGGRLGWGVGGVGHAGWGYRHPPYWAAAAIGAAAGAYYSYPYYASASPYYGYGYPAYSAYGYPAYAGYTGGYPYWAYSYVTTTPWRYSACTYPGYGYSPYYWCRY